VTGARGPRSSLTLAERAVLAAFTGSADRTRAQLSEATGLSRAVVAGVVQTLVERGELAQAEESPDARSRGRPSARYRRLAFLPPVLLIHLRHDSSTAVGLLAATARRRRNCPASPGIRRGPIGRPRSGSPRAI